MPGNKEGFLKRRENMIKRFGSEEAYLEHQRNIAAKGGRVDHDGGFASTKVGSDGLTGKERARLAGRLGGSISKRVKKHA